MEAKYWHKAWSENKIGFHLSEINPTLEKFGEKLLSKDNQQAFLPMCGKSLDLLWFSQRVDHVYGVELSEKAIRDFFEENNLTFDIEQDESFKVFKSHNISIYCGDFFRFPLEKLSINIIFDRGALVALPLEMRQKYYQKMKSELMSEVSWLLSTFDYPQQEMDGPPFSVTRNEIDAAIGGSFNVELLEQEQTDGFGVDGLKLCAYLIKR